MLASDETLYQRLLGAEFARLAPALKQFHSLRERALATGVMKVEGGQNSLARLVARLAGMPLPADDVKVRLVVTADGRGERWERWFGERPLISWQSASGGLLVESFGFFAIGFGLVAEDGGLRFVPRRMWMFGIPWPLRVGPRIDALTTPSAAGWVIDVRLALPLMGPLVHYHGSIHPL